MKVALSAHTAVVAQCPHCEDWSTFEDGQCSDMDVECMSCGKKYNLGAVTQ